MDVDIHFHNEIKLMKNLVPIIKAQELFSLLQSKKEEVYLIDVREPEEFEFTKIDGSDLVPLGEVPERARSLKDLHLNSNIVVICRSGQRSSMATSHLCDLGFTSVRNLEGGLLEYSKFDNAIIPY